ncbi:hypothetical protein [Larsenimonas salina]|uniref:hypothetical protein n=1 Tax=Larsenimonas salina TaxID=1295565 RepID=UPI0020739FCE|nr:hypothetical protein [Larsenimonas salina]MCM5703857.1 hypothetical protein [Larsenimonas salina]
MSNSMTELWAWITANATVFSGLTSVGMLIIWGVYLQLFLHSFRSQRRPQIIINRGLGRDLNAQCLISNMSESAVFVETVIVCLIAKDESFCLDITDDLNDTEQQNQQSKNEQENGRWTRQGPLDNADYMVMGSFERLVRQTCEYHDLPLDDKGLPDDKQKEFSAVEIRVIGIFGSNPNPIGASRRFIMNCDDNGHLVCLTPESNSTRQWAKRRHRRVWKGWLKEID